MIRSFFFVGFSSHVKTIVASIVGGPAPHGDPSPDGTHGDRSLHRHDAVGGPPRSRLLDALNEIASSPHITNVERDDPIALVDRHPPLPCGHVYHTDCTGMCVAQGKETLCCICRAEVTSSSIVVAEASATATHRLTKYVAKWFGWLMVVMPLFAFLYT